MTTRTVHLGRRLVYHRPLWKAWLTWCERHGLDPYTMPAEQHIEVDDDQRTIDYDMYRRTDDGKLIIDPDDSHRVVIDRVRVQLEAPALPFPSGDIG